VLAKAEHSRYVCRSFFGRRRKSAALIRKAKSFQVQVRRKFHLSFNTNYGLPSSGPWSLFHHNWQIDPQEFAALQLDTE